MNTNFQSKYWGLQVLKDANEDYYYEFECFGNYTTVLSFYMESYYDYEDNISLEEFFKNSYYTFLWIRTNINSLYNIFAETAAWDNHNNLSIAESQLFSDNDTLANLIKIDKITFYYDNQFQIEFSLNGEYYNIYFSKDKKISYEY